MEPGVCSGKPNRVMTGLAWGGRAEGAPPCLSVVESPPPPSLPLMAARARPLAPRRPSAYSRPGPRAPHSAWPRTPLGHPTPGPLPNPSGFGDYSPGVTPGGCQARGGCAPRTVACTPPGPEALRRGPGTAENSCEARETKGHTCLPPVAPGAAPRPGPIDVHTRGLSPGPTPLCQGPESGLDPSGRGSGGPGRLWDSSWEAGGRGRPTPCSAAGSTHELYPTPHGTPRDPWATSAQLSKGETDRLGHSRKQRGMLAGTGRCGPQDSRARGHLLRGGRHSPSAAAGRAALITAGWAH